MGVGDWCSSGSRTIQLDPCYEEIGSQPWPGSNKLRWKGLWMKLKKEKRKFFESSGSLQQVPCYDEYTYWQNFDQGSGKDEPDNLCRSFSVRFSDPCRDFRKKGGV